jgi:hypothetical protein
VEVEGEEHNFTGVLSLLFLGRDWGRGGGGRWGRLVCFLRACVRGGGSKGESLGKRRIGEEK